MASASPVTWLDKLSTQLKIDIDCMDPKEAKRWLPFRPCDQTSNQRLVYEQIILPENRETFLRTAKELKDEGWEAILNRMSALICAKNIGNIDGCVLLQSSANYAYDTNKVVEHARAYVQELERAGVPKDRVCIKIPSTGPALNAAPILLKEGIRTLGTSITSVAQAIAASQAGCLSISPYYNLPWYHADLTQWPDVQDPALEHPMSARMVQIAKAYKYLKDTTGKEQPLLKPASFRSAREAMAMSEFSCQHATIPEDILQQLSILDCRSNPPPGTQKFKGNGIPAPRLAHLAKTDPLSGPQWNGVVASTDTDYLADNGAALTKAIAEDEVTSRALDEALKAFVDNELQSRKAIEEVLKQLQ